MLSCRTFPCQDTLRVSFVPCTSGIRGWLAFSVGHHQGYNFLVKRVCCQFAQGVTSDPRITFPYLLMGTSKNRLI
jgi:hypothetical protein